jgi:hypothetical protein
MIICHPLKLIFLKTKKVGGTSFEIALSSYCGPECVITPISKVDEDTREKLGYRGAQNYENVNLLDSSLSNGSFFNHITAKKVAGKIPNELWQSYRKITIVRDPFDAAISRYYWSGEKQTGLNFEEFVSGSRNFISDNTAIAPLVGPRVMDNYLQFENLQEDINALKIPGLWERFSAIKAKSGHRPTTGASVQEIYRKYPRVAKIVMAECPDLIRRFGYKSPLRKVDR